MFINSYMLSNMYNYADLFYKFLYKSIYVIFIFYLIIYSVYYT